MREAPAPTKAPASKGGPPSGRTPVNLKAVMAAMPRRPSSKSDVPAKHAYDQPVRSFARSLPVVAEKPDLVDRDIVAAVLAH